MVLVTPKNKLINSMVRGCLRMRLGAMRVLPGMEYGR